MDERRKARRRNDGIFFVVLFCVSEPMVGAVLRRDI